MINKNIIFYVVLIIVILVLVFFSQQAVFRVIGQKLISAASDKATAQMGEGFSLTIPDIGSKIGQQLQSGGETIKNTIETAQEKISNVEKNISNYISGIANSIAGKSSNSCPVEK